MSDEKPAPAVPDDDPAELIEAALSSRAAAAQLRAAVRTAAREGRSVGVTTPDGRNVTGGDDVLLEAAQLDGAAELDAVLAIALLLRDVCAHLDELRRQIEPPPPAPIFSTAADVNRAAYGDKVPFAVPREMLGLPPEEAPQMHCVIEVYHSNHLWWGRPTDGGVVGGPVRQIRYFCPGVSYPAPQVRTPQAGS